MTLTSTPKVDVEPAHLLPLDGGLVTGYFGHLGFTPMDDGCGGRVDAENAHHAVLSRECFEGGRARWPAARAICAAQRLAMATAWSKRCGAASALGRMPADMAELIAAQLSAAAPRLRVLQSCWGGAVAATQDEQAAYQEKPWKPYAFAKAYMAASDAAVDAAAIASGAAPDPGTAYTCELCSTDTAFCTCPAMTPSQLVRSWANGCPSCDLDPARRAAARLQSMCCSPDVSLSGSSSDDVGSDVEQASPRTHSPHAANSRPSKRRKDY
jgi:hypothetical protein